MQYLIYLVFLLLFIQYDIDILRDFIHDIRYLANILSNNQYNTSPSGPPCWNNGVDSNKFLQNFPNSNFKPQK